MGPVVVETGIIEAMRPTIIIRSRLGMWTVGVIALICATLIVRTALLIGAAAAVEFAALPVLICVIGWMLWYYPRVEISDDGVAIANPLRSVRIPLSAITETTARGALRIHTGQAHYTAWAAPARGGYRQTFRPGSGPAIAVDIPDGDYIHTINADAAATARLIDAEQIIRTASTYRREAAAKGRIFTHQETGWRWNYPVLAIFALSVGYLLVTTVR